MDGSMWCCHGRFKFFWGVAYRMAHNYTRKGFEQTCFFRPFLAS